MSKKALLIGINYIGSDGELSGCINDINDTKHILKSVYKYDDKDINMLSDEADIKPTKQNIIKHLNKLVDFSNEEDVSEIWVSYSGHGSYVRDRNRDEDDGKDEC